MTFRECGEAYIAAHETSWRNLKHRQQWRNTLDTYVYPLLGDMPVRAIDTGLVMQVIDPIWRTKPETASRVRGRIESVLDWATARDHRQGDNPARWRGHVDKLLPKKTDVRKVRHQSAMPYDEVPGFMAQPRGQDSISARALEFTILAAARTSEAIGASWDEIDWGMKTWTIPSCRMKTEKQHRVPLAPRMIEALEKLPREKGNPHLFIGARPGRGLSNLAMLELLGGMDGNGYTVHGFRSSFRDWCAEQTNYPRELAEAALAYVLKDKTEAACQRGDLFEKRRKLMRAWAGYCSLLPVRGKVVVLQGRPGDPPVYEGSPTGFRPETLEDPPGRGAERRARAGGIDNCPRRDQGRNGGTQNRRHARTGTRGATHASRARVMKLWCQDPHVKHLALALEAGLSEFGDRDIDRRANSAPPVSAQT